MKETIRTIIIYGVAILVLVLASYFYDNSKKEKLEKSIENTLYNYFKENDIHIAAHDFSIDNVEIVCVGNKAYIVEFALLFKDDEANSFDKLGATIYRENEDDEWIVRGFGRGFTSQELDTFNFKCYN